MNRIQAGCKPLLRHHRSRRPAALKIACRVNGEKTTLTIPGTADLSSALGGGWLLKSDDIAKIVG